jgi:prolyl oligopeptidase
MPDGSGFFYSRYEEPEEGAEFQAANRNQKVAFHRVGTEQVQDHVFYQRPDHPDWGFAPAVSDDGRWLVLHTWESGSRNLVTVFEIGDPMATPAELIDEWKGSYSFVGSEGDELFFFALDSETPRGAVRAASRDDLGRWTWRTLIPEHEDAIEEVTLVGQRLVVLRMHDATSRTSIYGLDGFEHQPLRTESFYSFSSFNSPPSVYRYDVASGETELLRTPEVPFDPADYQVSQVFYTSQDGTRVPMFLAHKRGLERTGDNPTLLYGYGGFNIPLTPRYSPTVLAWMEQGGLYALANLRGGGEYGESWHLAGTKTNKQNVFDDFIAAAEFLIEEDYTSSEMLAIQGGSNGGLLVGAVMCQRPDLFGCCLPAVGVMDMLRFHLFTAGRFWTFDYGSVEDEQEFRALYAYSPYHNLEDGACYPPTLVTTADTDDRVVPGHSFKFAARLQEAQGCDNPTLIRIETSAGHGAGKPTQKRVEEAVDVWAFAAHALGMEIR